MVFENKYSDEEILSAMNEKHPIPVSMIAWRVGCSIDTIKQRILELERKRRVVCEEIVKGKSHKIVEGWRLA
jgi:hypothetical protein